MEGWQSQFRRKLPVAARLDTALSSPKLSLPMQVQFHCFSISQSRKQTYAGLRLIFSVAPGSGSGQSECVNRFFRSLRTIHRHRWSG